MAKNPIVIKASDFQYPTREELIEIYKDTPDLHNFGFPYVDQAASMFSDSGIAEVYRDVHLHYWDGVLLNRNGALAHTYHNATVNYMRGIPEDMALFEHHHFINRVHFDYYAEIFYYHFSSVKDTIAQILNIYYDLRIPEHKIYFNLDFLKRIPNQIVIDTVTAFFTTTKLAKDFRDSFTHRTPINYPDTRCTVKWEISELTYYSAADSYVKSPVIKANMDVTIKAVADLLDELKVLMPMQM